MSSGKTTSRVPRPGARPPRRGCRAAVVVRLAVFVMTTAVVLGAAGWLMRPRGEGPGKADRNVTVTMAGFEPMRITATAGKAMTVKLINPDSPFHSDGGGVHQLAIPELGLDEKVQPRSTRIITIPAAAPGEYRYYCDVCCGGKENPMMQGTLTVQ